MRTGTVENSISGITQNVFAMLLGIRMARSDGFAFAAGRPTTTGVVTISGGWCGAITVTVDGRTGRRIAAHMFGTSLERATDGEVNDAIGEVANMIGGNFKSRLAQPALLSLPTVAHGTGCTVSVPGSREVGRFGFESAGNRAIVTVVDHDWKRGGR